MIEEEVAKLTIRKWLDDCLRRIREKEQSLIAGLRAMNEPLMHTLKPLEEMEQENEEDNSTKDADKAVTEDTSEVNNEEESSEILPLGMAGSGSNNNNINSTSGSSSILKPQQIHLDGIGSENKYLAASTADHPTTPKTCLFPNLDDLKNDAEKTSVQKIYYANKHNDNLSKSTMNTIQNWWQEQIDYDSCNEDD